MEIAEVSPLGGLKRD